VKQSIVRRIEALEQAAARPDPAAVPAWASDPVAMMERLEMTPDPWQRQFLSSRSDRVLACCARQTGKSTCLAVTALATMYRHPGALVLISAPVGRQSNESYQKLIRFYRLTGRLIPAERELRTELVLSSGSRCVSLPGDTASIRGYSKVHTVIIDECAQVDDILPGTLLPILAMSRGRCIIASTPFGKRGWFFEQMYHGGDVWDRHVARAEDCLRYDRDFIEQSRKLLGERWCSQEFGCEFVESIGSVFRSEDVLRAFSGEVRALPGF
jgi:hypothetical protein